MSHDEFGTKAKSYHNISPGNNRRKQLPERLKLCLIVGFIYLLLAVFSIGCPLRFMTGIPCPGCGMTRAVRYALQLDFVSAWHYHPLFFLTPLMLLLFLFESYVPPKIIRGFWTSIIVLFLLTYLLRLFLFHSNVLQIDIHSGVVLRLLHNIYTGGYQ